MGDDRSASVRAGVTGEFSGSVENKIRLRLLKVAAKVTEHATRVVFSCRPPIQIRRSRSCWAQRSRS